MTAVRRPNPQTLLLNLTRQLAEEFDTVPIPMVSGAVTSAVAAAGLFGNKVAASMETIERIAREDLAAVAVAVAESGGLALAG